MNLPARIEAVRSLLKNNHISKVDDPSLFEDYVESLVNVLKVVHSRAYSAGMRRLTDPGVTTNKNGCPQIHWAIGDYDLVIRVEQAGHALLGVYDYMDSSRSWYESFPIGSKFGEAFVALISKMRNRAYDPSKGKENLEAAEVIVA